MSGRYGPFRADPGAQENRVDTTNAKRAEPRPPVVRRIKGYVAYDLHSLLEHESDGDRARPGHPLG